MPNHMIYISAALSERFKNEDNKSGLINHLLAEYYAEPSKQVLYANLAHWNPATRTHVNPSSPTEQPATKARPCKICGAPMLGGKCLQKHG